MGGADAGPAHTVYNPEAMRIPIQGAPGSSGAQALEAGQMALPPSMSVAHHAMALENDSDSEVEAPPAKMLKTGEVLNVMSEQNFIESNPGELLYIVQIL